MNAPTDLRTLLCEQWCADLEVNAQDPAGIRISLPMVESDGDELTVWLNPELGGWKISDSGTTMMRLSYHLDLDDISEGTRQRVLQQVLTEHGVSYDQGTLSIVVEEAALNQGMLSLGQAMVRVGDIAMWSRQHVATQFYDDLRRELERIVGADRLIRDYQVPGISEAASYEIDFAIVDGLPKPFYIFGVPTGDKSRLATIVLQHLRAAKQSFESLVVLAGLDSVPRQDLRRLMNAAGDMVDSLQSLDALDQKVRLRAVA